MNKQFMELSRKIVEPVDRQEDSQVEALRREVEEEPVPPQEDMQVEEE